MNNGQGNKLLHIQHIKHKEFLLLATLLYLTLKRKNPRYFERPYLLLHSNFI